MKKILILIGICVVMLITNPVYAALAIGEERTDLYQVTIKWDACPGENADTIYWIYSGIENDMYERIGQVQGVVHQETFYVTPGKHFFRVTCYPNGLGSSPSSEISIVRPHKYIMMRAQ